MDEKREEMRHALCFIETMMRERGALIRIEYELMTEEKIACMSRLEKKLHPMLSGDEQILVWDDVDGQLLYNVNVTGDSALCAVFELMRLLKDKY